MTAARTSIWSGSAEQLDAWANAARERVKPMAEELPGNKGAYFFLDRENGRALTLTIWESEEAARSTDERAEESRKRTMEATGVELVSADKWEVVA
jgi:heme-degrading monooxygenase HmoA